MDLKFYLNKFVKVDNIEHYTLKTLLTLKKSYEDYLDKSEGFDPDFPSVNFNNKGQKLSFGKNIYSQFKDEEDIPDDFGGILGNREMKPEIYKLDQPTSRKDTRREREQFNKRNKNK